MKNDRLIHFVGQTFAVIAILLCTMCVLTVKTWGQSPVGKNRKQSQTTPSEMTWKDKFPYLWRVAYPDKSSEPEPKNVSYNQFVKAVAGGIRQDPEFLNYFKAYALKEKLNLHDYLLSGYENRFGMKFQYIEPGMFNMGSSELELGREPNERMHQVYLTDAFLMQTTEVTQAQWETVLTEAETRGISIKGLRKTPSQIKKCGNDCPVESVSWDDIQKWICILNLLGYGKYALPTEAQWEFAARAGSASAFSNGGINYSESCVPVDPNLGKVGWYCGNSDATIHPAAAKSPNKLGLYDMHGNVWEWCRDWYDDYPLTIVTADPAGPTDGSTRVLRGGSWGSNAWECRSAFRFSVGPGYRSRYFGFRLIMFVDRH